MGRIRGRLGAVVVVAFAAAAAAAPPASAATVAGLWHMDEVDGTTMVDASGNGLDGSLLGVTTGQPGFTGDAGDLSYGFFGKPSIVTVPSSPLINPGSADIAVSARLRMTQKPSQTVGDYDVVRKGLAGTKGGDYKVEVLDNGYLFCRFRGAAGALTYRHGPNLADGAWHQVSCTRTATGLTLTVDGRSWSKTGKTGSISNTSALLVGTQDNTGTDQYSGLMDELSVTIG